MRSRPAIFTAHLNPQAPDASAGLELVPEGFAWWALVFQPFWLIYHRQWLVLLLFTLGLGGTLELAKMAGLSAAALALLQAFWIFLLAVFGQEWRRWTLSRRGYQEVAVLAAPDELSALRRYYDTVAA